MKRRIPRSGDEWFHRAVRYLARFDRTAAQVERFLTSKGASPSQVKQAITRLSAHKYLDDRRVDLLAPVGTRAWRRMRSSRDCAESTKNHWRAKRCASKAAIAIRLPGNARRLSYGNGVSQRRQLSVS